MPDPCAQYKKKKKKTTNLDTIVRHTLEREPPLPIYIGLKVHTACRSKELIKQLNRIGVVCHTIESCNLKNGWQPLHVNGLKRMAL